MTPDWPGDITPLPRHVADDRLGKRLAELAADEAEVDQARPCYRCGKDPADGYASTWGRAVGERWYCHGDDDDVSCFERTQMSDAKTLPEIVANLLGPDHEENR